MIQLPKLNSSYWALMLLCTTMGELIGNLLSRNLALGYTQGAILDVCIFTVMIILFLTFKIRNEVFYWILILMGNIGGTNLADWVTLDPLESDKSWGILQPLQLGTKVGSLLVMGSLIFILILRFIATKQKNENKFMTAALYWFAILLSSTFGTTSGDYITNDTPLGALWGSLVLLAALAVVYSAFKTKILNGALAYWLALVLIHPVGATFGNWVSKPIGLDLGNIYTNIVMVILFIIIFIKNKKTNEASLKIQM